MRGRIAKDWFPDDKATWEWLNSCKKSSKCTYQTAWKYFLEYVGMTGDQILESRRTDNVYAWEQRVLDFKRWMMDTKKQSDYTAVTATGAARSFFAFHRYPSKFRKTESATLGKAKRKTEDYRFSRDDLKKMADMTDLEEQYVIVAGKSFGLRAGDFLALTRGDLEPYINRELPISLGEYHTQKESVKAYPFIDSDAQPIIKLMLETMSREGRTSPGERMLTFKDQITLSRTLKRVADKAGIQHGNKIIRFHCLRKFLIDNLSRFMSSEKWKQVVGKKINEAAYVSPDSLREDYARAMSETCFPSHMELDYIQKRQEASERITSKLISNEPLTDEDRTDIKRFKLALRDKKKCSDGEHCQRIVSEQELPELLAQGGHVAAVLPSGKIVVET